MSTPLKVTLAGAAGAVGAPILDSLIEGGFDVTILARDVSKYSSSNAKTIVPDYSDMDKLISLLRGEDVVISTLGGHATTEQLALFNAAVKAGVKRFIPSEWGSDSTNAIVGGFPGPIYGEKAKLRKLIEQAAAEHPGFSYTYVITGPFFDWGMMAGLIIDVKNDKLERFNGGDVRFSSTRVSTIGQSVATILKRFDETKNRVIKIHDGVFTQNQLLEVAEKLKGKKFTIVEVNAEVLEEQCWVMCKDPNAEPMAWILGFIKVACWGGEKVGSELKETDNAFLGLKEYSGEEARDLTEGEMKKLL